MDKLTSQKRIRQITEKYGFRFTKSLGQNFLVDENILRKIVESSKLTKEDVVIEIGPGAGTLTRALAEEAGKVVAIEIDKNLLPILSETLGDLDNVCIINEDVLKVDLHQIVSEYATGKAVKVVANLPYYITTPIIMRFLEEGVAVESMTVMMQKEVADRIHAKPNSKDYGSLSIAVQYYCDTTIIARAPKGAFVPMPTVDSSVLYLHVKKEKQTLLKDKDLFFEVVRGAFSKRRKTLLNALSTYGSLGGKQEAQQALTQAGIDAGRRAETLAIEEFANLSNAYADILSESGSFAKRIGRQCVDEAVQQSEVEREDDESTCP